MGTTGGSGRGAPRRGRRGRRGRPPARGRGVARVRAGPRGGARLAEVVTAGRRLARSGSPTPRPQKPPTARKLSPFHGALQERGARAAGGGPARRRGGGGEG